MSEYLEDDNTEQLRAEYYDDHEAYEEAYVPDRDMNLPIFFYIKKNKADGLIYYALTNGRVNFPLYAEHNSEDHHCTAQSADGALRAIQVANRRMMTDYMIKSDI